MTTATDTHEIARRLHRCAAILAGHDRDRAGTWNGVGYSKFDSDFGHALAERPPEDWTPKMLAAAWKMLRKYRGQLAHNGVDFEEIPEPPAYVPPPASQLGGSIVLTTEGAEVSFPYNPQAVDDVKQIPGRRAFDHDRKVWLFVDLNDTAQLIGLRSFGETYGLQGTADLPPLPAEVEERVKFEIPNKAAADVARSRAHRRVEIHDGKFELVFPFDPRAVEELRAGRIAGAKWDKKRRAWAAPLHQVEAVIEFAREHGFVASKPVHEYATGFAAERAERAEHSQALDAPLDVPGLGGDLHPFQRAGVRYATAARRTFLADEMGLGKTVQALATAQASDAFPILAVVPNNVALKWAAMVDYWLPNRSISFLSSRSRPTEIRRMREAGGGRRAIPANHLGADVLIVNYEKISGWLAPEMEEVYNPDTGDVDRVQKKVGNAKQWYLTGPLEALADSRGDDRGEPGGTLIFDESHLVKNPQAKRTVALEKIAPLYGHRLALSGTPDANGRPEELIPQLRILGRLEDFGGDAEYRRQFVYRRNHVELNRQLRATCYVRRLKKDVLTELPAKQRETEEIPLADRAAYERVEADVISWMGERAAELARLAELEDDEVDEAKYGAMERAMKAEALVRLNALRLVAAQQKLGGCIEWIEAFMRDSGQAKLVIFAHHVEIQRGLLAKLAAYNPAEILGGVPNERRAEQMVKFQTDPSCKVVVCSTLAANVGIELTASSHVAFVELEWRPGDHDQAEDRCYGRLDDPHGLNAYYLLGERTVEEWMAELLDEKRKDSDAIRDGREGTSGASILGSLIKRMTRAAA